MIYKHQPHTNILLMLSLCEFQTFDMDTFTCACSRVYKYLSKIDNLGQINESYTGNIHSNSCELRTNQ